MQINLSWDASASYAPTGFKAAVQQAANILDAQILNNLTVTINVGWGEDAGTPFTSATGLALGGPDNGAVCSYAQLTGALTAQAAANGCAFITANLPATDPTSGAGSWAVSQAQAKVFGLSDPTVTATDGSIGFASDVSWNFTGSQNIGASQYDLAGTALHEITHALGRLNDASYGYYSPINLYTYASQGALQLGASAPAYFSTNGGATNLNSFDMSTNGDPADWANTLTDSFGPGLQGAAMSMSATDWLMMESLGYHIAPAYILSGPSSVNIGAHDFLQVSTLNVPAGTVLGYTISGLSASQLDSNSLTGNVAIGTDGTALIDLGISPAAPIQAPVQATVNLANHASYAITVETGANNALDFKAPGILLASTAQNDTFNGSATDIVSYSGYSTDYSIISPSSGTVQIQDQAPNRDGTDTLIGVGRAQFQDESIAFDLGSNQSAGLAVEMLSAAFGKGALSNPVFVGIGIKLFDQGDNMGQVAQIAINTGAVSAPDPASFVKAVWQNIFGTPIDAADLSYYTGLLTSNQTTEANLLSFAAGSTVNQNHINLVGLAAHGIAYTPA